MSDEQLYPAGRGIFDLGSCWLTAIRQSDRFYIAEPGRNGTRKLTSTRTSDIWQAMLRLQSRHQELQRAVTNAPRPPEEVLIDEIQLDYWEEHAKNLPSAIAARNESRRILELYSGLPVSAINDPDLKAFFKDMVATGYAPSTARRTICTLRSALNHAERYNGLTHFHPITLKKLRAERPELEIQDPKGRRLTENEIVRLFEVAPSRQDRRYLLLLIGTLGRPEAVRELEKTQIDFELGCIRLNPDGREQTKKYRPTVPLIDVLRDELENVNPGPLLAYPHLPAQRLRRDFRLLREWADLDARVNPYSFRHTFAYWLKARRIPAEEISQYLGHRPAKVSPTTAIYIGEEFESLIPASEIINEILERILEKADRKGVASL